MKKAVFAILGVCCLLAAQEASALQAEVRGFTLCTAIDGGHHCTAGTFWHADWNLYHASAESCDWTGGSCQVWVPKDKDSFADAVGVNWTCCFELDSGETDGSVQMSVFDYDLTPPAWSDSPDYQGYIGTRFVWGVCDFADYVYKGGETAHKVGGWDYGAGDRVARCTAKAWSPAGAWINKGFEYWMED
jgi:hypothetical protein